MASTPLPRHVRAAAPRRASIPFLVLAALLVSLTATVAAVATAPTPPAQAEVGVTTDSSWAPFVGEYRMWCTKSTGSGACASHHNGWAIDIDIVFNDPVYSTGAGEVVQLFGGCDPQIGYCNGGAGNWVSVDHDTHWARYIHLASFAPGLELGSWVEPGQLIGYAGASGTSNGGVHLHYDETLPQSLPVTRVFFGPFMACHGDTAVQYPDVLGTTDWQQVPHGSMLRNDGYECLGGTTPEPPPPPEPPEEPPPAPRDPSAPGGATGLAIGDFLGNGLGGVAIGAPGEDIGSIVDAGAVMVAHNDGSGLARRDEAIYQGGKGLRGANEASDLAGAAVAVGDFDCDGYDDLATGIPGEAIGSVEDAGTVNVAYGSPTTLRSNRPISLWQNNRPLPGPHEAGDMTGAALAVGDFDADGCDDLAIGIPGEDIDDLVDAGAAVVIHGGPGGFSANSRTSPLLYQGGVLAGFTEAGDLVGATLAAGDFNCDGYDDLAIGAPHETVGSAVRSGAVSIIFSDGSGIGSGASTTIFQSEGLAGVLEAEDQVGTALAAGDFNADGCDDLAAGAALEDLDGGQDAGAVSVAFGSPSGFASSTVHYQGGGGVYGNIEAGDHTGSAVVAVDLNCDGYDDLAVGIAGEGIGSRDNAGYVAVLGGSATGISGTVSRYYQGGGGLKGANETGDGAGTALAAGDINGDGCDDLVIAGPGEDIGSRTDAGVVWVVLGDSSSPTFWGALYQGKNLPGAAEAGDVLGSPSVRDLLGIPS